MPAHASEMPIPATTVQRPLPASQPSQQQLRASSLQQLSPEELLWCHEQPVALTDGGAACGQGTWPSNPAPSGPHRACASPWAPMPAPAWGPGTPGAAVMLPGMARLLPAPAQRQASGAGAAGGLDRGPPPPLGSSGAAGGAWVSAAQLQQRRTATSAPAMMNQHHRQQAPAFLGEGNASGGGAAGHPIVMHPFTAAAGCGVAPPWQVQQPQQTALPNGVTCPDQRPPVPDMPPLPLCTPGQAAAVAHAVAVAKQSPLMRVAPSVLQVLHWEQKRYMQQLLLRQQHLQQQREQERLYRHQQEAAAAAAWPAAPEALQPVQPQPVRSHKRKASGARKPPAPRSAPQEANWRQDKWASLVAHADAALQKGLPAKWPRTLPEHSTARFAVLVLLHQAGWPNWRLWQRWKDAHEPGAVAIFTHMKAGVPLHLGMPGRDAIGAHRLKANVDACWGQVSLVQAQLEALGEVLRRCPHVQHVGLASGHDIPLRLIREGVLCPGVSYVGSYAFQPREAAVLREVSAEQLRLDLGMARGEAEAWAAALSFHHQWAVLSREHASLLAVHRPRILQVAKSIHAACTSVRAGMAPDEFALLTALRFKGCVRGVVHAEVRAGLRHPPGTLVNCYPTLVMFPAESSPHPVLWTQLSELVQCQVDKEGGEEVFQRCCLAECLELAKQRTALFFRKVEIRQTCPEELAALLSLLELLWAEPVPDVQQGSGGDGGTAAISKRGRASAAV